jgi:hypothetical protein
MDVQEEGSQCLSGVLGTICGRGEGAPDGKQRQSIAAMR